MDSPAGALGLFDTVAAHALGVGATLPLFVLVVLAIGRERRERMEAWSATPARLWLLPALLLGYCLFFMAVGGEGSIGQAAALAAYFAAPTLLLYAWGRGGTGIPDFLFDALIILLIWLPVEFHRVQKSIALQEGNYPLTVFSAVLFALLVFAPWRRIEIHCDWRLPARHLGIVAGVYVALLAVILPPAFSVGFVHVGLNHRLEPHVWTAPFILAGFFFTPAFCEEVMFRGLIQGLLASRLRAASALGAAAVVFGLAHLNNTVRTPERLFDQPDWTYAGFATIAGLGYGFVYQRTRSLVASSLLHALVDWTWFMWFKG